MWLRECRPEGEDRQSSVRSRLGRHHVFGTAHGVLAPGTTDVEGEEVRQDAGHHRENAHQQLGLEGSRQNRQR